MLPSELSSSVRWIKILEITHLENPICAEQVIEQAYGQRCIAVIRAPTAQSVLNERMKV